MLKAGAAQAKITPPVGTSLAGYFEDRFSTAVHDDLFASALVLDDGGQSAAIVCCDLVRVGRPLVEKVRALASRATGIPESSILVSATHTHSAPASNVKEGPEPAVAYRKVLVEGIAESIVRAHGRLRPAAVGAAAHPLPDEVFNRRWFLKPGKMPPNPFGGFDKVKMNPGTSPDVLDRPAGPTDPDVTILSVHEAKSRRPLALLANYSLHYVGGTPRGQVSADYYGEFARLAPSRVGASGDFVAMMSNGTSGDINNIPFLVNRPPREPFEQIRIVAQKAADAAWHARAKIKAHQGDARLGMIQRDVTLRLRRPTAEQIAAAKAVLAVKDDAGRAKLPPLAEAYARRTLALAEGPETLKATVQALRIGDLAICTFPFETFAEIGLDLKKRSPFPRTMVMGIANGYNGYLPTPEQHRLGGYETWLGTCRVQDDASVILSGQLLEMLAELAKAK